MKFLQTLYLKRVCKNVYSHELHHQRHIEKKLESIEGMTSAQEAAKKMKDKNVSSLVVVDVNGKPEGLVTEGDLVRKVCINDVRPSTVTTKEIMSFPLITIKASSSPSAAADMMLKTT